MATPIIGMPRLVVQAGAQTTPTGRVKIDIVGVDITVIALWRGLSPCHLPVKLGFPCAKGENVAPQADAQEVGGAAMVSGAGEPDRPPGTVRAAVIILAVLAVFGFLLFLSEFVAGLDSDDTTRRAASQTGAFLLISLFCALTARQTWRGYRGGLVLAVLIGLFVTCSGVSLTSAPAPFNVLGAVPLSAGVVIIVLLLAPARSRAWFCPRR